MVRIADVDVVAPNFKRRLSGVTSTIVSLVPRQAEETGIAGLGPGLPPHLPKIAWWQLPGLLRRPRRHRFRIWHARRNIEMLVGLVLKFLFLAPLKIVFTSAAQRRHTRFTRFLIARMDAVVATSRRSGGFLEVPHTVVMHGVDCERFHPPGESEGRGGGGNTGSSPVAANGRLFRPYPPPERNRPVRRCDDPSSAGPPGLDRPDHGAGDAATSRVP